jgi:hypothetical protein
VWSPLCLLYILNRPPTDVLHRVLQECYKDVTVSTFVAPGRKGEVRGEREEEWENRTGGSKGNSIKLIMSMGNRILNRARGDRSN